MVVKRIGIGSAAKLSGAMYGSMGLFIGIIVSLASFFGAGLAQLAGSEDAPPAFMGVLFGVGAIVLLPLLYGLLGLVIGAVTAGLYNLFARMVGGLTVEME